MKNIMKNSTAEWVSLDKVYEITFYNSVDSVSLIKKAFKLKSRLYESK